MTSLWFPTPTHSSCAFSHFLLNPRETLKPLPIVIGQQQNELSPHDTAMILAATFGRDQSQSPSGWERLETRKSSSVVSFSFFIWIIPHGPYRGAEPDRNPPLGLESSPRQPNLVPRVFWRAPWEQDCETTPIPSLKTCWHTAKIFIPHFCLLCRTPTQSWTTSAVSGSIPKSFAHVFVGMIMPPPSLTPPPPPRPPSPLPPSHGWRSLRRIFSPIRTLRQTIRNGANMRRRNLCCRH